MVAMIWINPGIGRSPNERNDRVRGLPCCCRRACVLPRARPLSWIGRNEGPICSFLFLVARL